MRPARCGSVRSSSPAAGRVRAVEGRPAASWRVRWKGGQRRPSACGGRAAGGVLAAAALPCLPAPWISSQAEESRETGEGIWERGGVRPPLLARALDFFPGGGVARDRRGRRERESGLGGEGEPRVVRRAGERERESRVSLACAGRDG
jgi:hypothetical protein